MLRSLRVDVVEVRLPAHLEGISALVLPGGESTTLAKLLARWGLVEPVKALASSGVPVWGTCAGAILLSSEVAEKDHPIDQQCLGLARVRAVRNAFGRQVHSFCEDLDVSGISGPFPGVFIRAPFLEPLSPEVEVLCRVRESPVFLRDRNVWLSSFHPELTGDRRIHEMFLRQAGVISCG